MARSGGVEPSSALGRIVKHSDHVAILDQMTERLRLENAELRQNLDAATRRWAQLVYGRNAAAGPYERDFTIAMAEVNTFRHACGFAMLAEPELKG